MGRQARSLAKAAKVDVLGPAEAPLARIRGRFRHHLILKAEGALSLNRVAAKLLNITNKPAKVNIRVDIDPQQML